MNIWIKTAALGIFLCYSLIIPVSGSPDLGKAEKFLERSQILYENSDYDSLPYYFQTAKVIFQKYNKPIQVTACILGMSDYYRVNNHPEKAAATLDSAENYIRIHIGLDSECWADALNTRAKLLALNDQSDEAIELLDQSLSLLNALDVAPKKIAKTQELLGISYFKKEDLQKALEYYTESYQTYMQITNGPSPEKGWLLFNIGLLHNNKGNYHEAREYISRSITNNLACFGPDYPELARSYNSLATVYIENGMSDSALSCLERCEEIQRNTLGEYHKDLIALYIQHARIFRLEGNYARALEYYKQAQKILMENNSIKGYQGRKLMLNMANLYKAMMDYKSAEAILLNLTDLKEKVHPTSMATYYYNLADINRLLGDYNRSECYFKKVFEIRDEYLAQDDYTRGFDYLAYGMLLDSLGMYERAEGYFHRAIKIIQQKYGFHHLVTARFLKSTGDHFQLSADPRKALNYYQQSINAMDPDYDVAGLGANPPLGRINDNLFYLGLLKNKAQVLNDLAETTQDHLKKTSLLKGSLNTYLTSNNIIDLLRNSYLGERSKMYLSENERDTYEKCVETAYRCYELTTDPEYLNQAFRVAEKGKYATLLSVLQREETIKLAGIPDSIVQLDASLRRELSFQQELLLENQADSLYDTLAVERYKAGIFQLMAQIESFNKRLEREFPGYYDLLYNQRVTDPASFRKKLRSNEKLLEYFYAGSNLYCFELTKRAMECHRIRVDTTFELELAIIEGFLSHDFLLDTLEFSHELFLAAAHSLHERLIPAPRDHTRLIIIPEGELSYFPFDILVTEPVHDFSGLYNEVPFLIRNHSIRYGYSATLMDQMGKGGRIKLNRLIAFAPGYGADKDMVASAGDKRVAVDRESLRPLPGSIREAVEIGRISGGRAFTGESASEDLFKKLAGEGHILHLATHAFLDDEDPLQSKLVFSEDNVVEDGFLNVYEIYNLDLTARMVVLSACNTGAGLLKRGEGIMSLARAFIYAGVPNIVMTLWTVSDRQGYRLMLDFYKLLIAGRSTEDALRKAKLDFLEEASPAYQHPQYWAGYILVGNPDRLFMSRIKKIILLLVPFTIMGLMGYLIIIRRKILRSQH